MTLKNSNRRDFLKVSGAAVAASAVSWNARSYATILGANDRVNIGVVGCGDRMKQSLIPAFLQHSKELNFQFTAISDLWSLRREEGVAYIQKLSGNTVDAVRNNDELYARKDVDAVLVATADFQHAQHGIEAVNAGRDAYVEKPTAHTMDDARNFLAAVKKTGKIVQVGTQRRSTPAYMKAAEYIKSGAFGDIVMVEMTWNVNQPGRWRRPDVVPLLKEQDTDWKRWLMSRPWRAFDPRVYFEFRIFKEFSGGITDQWYSHGSGLAHFYLDTFIPDDTVANGGIFAWHDVRENPDTFQCLSTFAQKEVLYSYATTFGNAYGDHTILRGTRGTLYSPGGEGSPQWWYLPETSSGWESNVVFDLHAGKVKPEAVTLPDRPDVPSLEQSDNLKDHTDNWLSCIRSRKTPNGSIDTGFAHAVAVVMANRAYREGKKMFWDRKAEQILDHPAA